ncbi:BON domain-containing protein [Paraburkholderia heleia]|uniref:BON domain-containing protein n=1 Tax=Paraburkholderia heleia TaxID=634127 RepID=UPI0031D0582F
MSAAAQRKANHSLSVAVRHALARAQGFDTSNVAVKARDGVITIEGTVPDAAQIPQATQVALKVSGVRLVINHLTVDGGGGGG